jgi:hypothetical protein
LLAGCAEPAPESPPASATSSPTAVPAQPAGEAPAIPAQPSEAPTVAEPSPAPTASAAVIGPPLDSMRIAAPSNSKTGVAADLRYSFDSPVQQNQPVTLHLAAVPRVPGAELKVSVQQDPGVQLIAGAPTLQKTSTSNIYRQQISVTKLDAAPTHVRVLVSMDMAAGSAFGFFSIPFDTGTSAQKQDSVKQR